MVGIDGKQPFHLCGGGHCFSFYISLLSTLFRPLMYRHTMIVLATSHFATAVDLFRSLHFHFKTLSGLSSSSSQFKPIFYDCKDCLILSQYVHVFVFACISVHFYILARAIFFPVFSFFSFSFFFLFPLLFRSHFFFSFSISFRFSINTHCYFTPRLKKLTSANKLNQTQRSPRADAGQQRRAQTRNLIFLGNSKDKMFISHQRKSLRGEEERMNKLFQNDY